MAEQWIELGRVMERQQYAGRHVKPRRGRPGYLRLVTGEAAGQ